MLQSGVDGVLVINLDRRPDRWATFQTVWGLGREDHRVVRISACDGVALKGYGDRPWFRGRRRDRSWAGRAGCALSHIRALAHVRQRGWRRALILEDDAVPSPAFQDGALEDALARQDWSMLYLGCQEAWGPIKPAAPGLAWIGGALDAHAYVVEAALADWMLPRLPHEDEIWPWIAEQRAWDRWLRREVGRSHAILACDPAVVVQSEGHSDISIARRHEDGPTSLAMAPDGPLDALANAFSRVLEPSYDKLRGRLKRFSGF